MNDEDMILRLERQSILIGTMVGQISDLLNQIQKNRLSTQEIYHDLFDIHQSAGLQIHEIYYKGNTSS